MSVTLTILLIAFCLQGLAKFAVGFVVPYRTRINRIATYYRRDGRIITGISCPMRLQEMIHQAQNVANAFATHPSRCDMRPAVGCGGHTDGGVWRAGVSGWRQNEGW